jgi:SAM-dependent methyltransferase
MVDGMKKLSELNYWNSKYQSHLGTEKVFVTKKRRFEPYSQLLFWRLCKNYLPKDEGLKFLEIGCAPGQKGIKFHQIFGYQPFGVDYSLAGCELTKKVFTANGGNPNNVFLADFLSDEFQIKYKNYFDIVASFGLIEHFDDSKEVVNKHINLLKRGGYLLITIPNKRGFFNFILSYIFNKEGIKIHNLKIMEKKEFEKLFDESKLTKLYCNYFGVFNFGLFNVKEGSLKRHLLFLCIAFQIILNFLFRILFKRKSIESRFFSPYLIYIGKMK